MKYSDDQSYKYFAGKFIASPAKATLDGLSPPAIAGLMSITGGGGACMCIYM
jgi:hypothetical protein